MSKNDKFAISPTRQENYPEWYQQVIKASDLAENSDVRGCMVIKPWGFSIWENMQRILDGMFKETGHVNAYFPLLIPLSFLEKEAEHVKGFAKECAVVTHHRLEAKEGGGLQPAGKLEEPFIIRPTSETIIGSSYSKWVKSYRDLPLLINQWANVMRWEMRTRLFLRTTEFLWQEGHTVHATKEEAIEETLRMLDVYEKFAHDTMAMPVIKGAKTSDERFPGAVDTYSIEALMQDGKALQAGTSHFLGRNFSKASNIKFLNKEGVEEFAWTTSWGASTRLIGGLIMTHSDDNGLVLPPKLAPCHVVIIPIYKSDAERGEILSFCNALKEALVAQKYNDAKIICSIDDRDMRGGEKAWQHIKKGVPIRLEIGARELSANSLFMGQRDKDPRDKVVIGRVEFVKKITQILDEIQVNLFNRARKYRDENIKKINSLKEFEEYFREDSGFALSHWNEAAIGHEALAKLKVTPRCIPIDGEREDGKCIFTGKDSKQRILFAKAY